MNEAQRARAPVAPNSTSTSAIKIGTIARIPIYLHWLWFVVALFEISGRNKFYSSTVWNVAEYLSLFAIVFLHELGHALACRSVGGHVFRILLWPLGGVANVRPPQEPKAYTWTIAAGPLVNFVLIWVIAFASVFLKRSGASADVLKFFYTLGIMNMGLLIFNMIPIYPLDGGQLLRCVLWFFMGRLRSLVAVSVLGIVSAAAIVFLAVGNQSIWFLLLAIFGGFQSFRSFKAARKVQEFLNKERRPGFECPSCHEAPPVGELWQCQCGQKFDTFATLAVCPQCQKQHPKTACASCGYLAPIQEFKSSESEASSIVTPDLRPLGNSESRPNPASDIDNDFRKFRAN